MQNKKPTPQAIRRKFQRIACLFPRKGVILPAKELT